MTVIDAEILILCKTYPSPSGKHTETSCVAGMDARGNLIRLFPVPFRLIAKDQQFKKWQWVKAKIEKAPKDHRPESHVIKVDTIKSGGDVSSKKEWVERRFFLDKLKLFHDFESIEIERGRNNKSLALLKPARITGLDISPVSNPNWTEEELAKLEQEQKQAGLFEDDDKPSIRTLKKLGHDFYYRYECDTPEGTKSFRHKIVDWEAGALYLRCVQTYQDDWEKAFRIKLEMELPSKDLMFLMGNIHRFQEQWLIISLIYPPNRQQSVLAL
jgi:hypothetical protein